MSIAYDGNPRDKITRRKIERMLLTLSHQNAALQKWNPHFNDTTMVMLVMIATMAFQASVSPPGGMWQEGTSSHSAGKAVMASTHPRLYKQFVSDTSTDDGIISHHSLRFISHHNLPHHHWNNKCKCLFPSFSQAYYVHWRIQLRIKGYECTPKNSK